MPVCVRESLRGELSHSAIRLSSLSPSPQAFCRELEFLQLEDRIGAFILNFATPFLGNHSEFDHDASCIREPQTSAFVPRTLRLKSQSSCRDIVCRRLSEIPFWGFIPSQLCHHLPIFLSNHLRV
jgi:hypothetical protein